MDWLHSQRTNAHSTNVVINSFICALQNPFLSVEKGIKFTFGPTFTPRIGWTRRCENMEWFVFGWFCGMHSQSIYLYPSWFSLPLSLSLSYLFVACLLSSIHLFLIIPNMAFNLSVNQKYATPHPRCFTARYIVNDFVRRFHNSFCFFFLSIFIVSESDFELPVFDLNGKRLLNRGYTHGITEKSRSLVCTTNEY